MSMSHYGTDQSSSSSWWENQQQGGQHRYASWLHFQNDGVPHEKEPLFEKPLTPSDVGKLNRLVIPKQHAEKHFPLGGGESAAGGVLLSFEDEAGKCWRFRYSYWNSSQSYVLTKGWSRYVKEKGLESGDVVLFLRHRTDGQRLFITWRRRGEDASAPTAHAQFQSAYHYDSTNTTPRYYQPDHPSPTAGEIMAESQTSTMGGGSRRLRLFGVNLECRTDDQDQSEPSTPDGSQGWTSHGSGATHQQYYYSHQSYPPCHNMDIRLSGDVNQMRHF